LVTVSIIPAAPPDDGAPLSVGAAFRLGRRHGLIAPADGRRNQFTGSRSGVELGILRELNEIVKRRPRHT
jgi:hypothetical protein